MKINFLCLFAFLCIAYSSKAQNSIAYTISFENAVHHEANIEVVFSAIQTDTLTIQMSRSSPGRYAQHEFAKNMYNMKAVDSKGNSLKLTRLNNYQWNVINHDGYIKITYTLFGNRGDGTYSQIDETHAHLNIPATFLYAEDYKNQPIKVNFQVREDLNWKVATQLKQEEKTVFSAPNLDYFMDSPVEISNHSVKKFTVSYNGKEQTINFALHHNGKEAEFNRYFEQVKKIVVQEIAVFGELPNFDFGNYTFLACYIPNTSGDGMEHRNSTVLTSTRGLGQGGMTRNIGTVAHEFFHAWNVERIRPKSLEPFDYSNANMSGELWFAEGFTSYYTDLILCRAGIISEKEYIEGLSVDLNDVWNSPARNYFNPIEMSYQAPFVDAATSIDPVNRENMYISYYTYGSVLGLAFDLSLRELNTDKNLDGFMQLVWEKYGKNEINYTIENLQEALSLYVGSDLSNSIFSKFIYDSKMPEYERLFKNMGVVFKQTKLDQAYFGASINQANGKWIINSNPLEKSAAYNANLNYGDQIISIDNKVITKATKINDYFSQFKPNQKVRIQFIRFGISKITELIFDANPTYTTSLVEKVTKKTLERRNSWLH